MISFLSILICIVVSITSESKLNDESSPLIKNYLSRHLLEDSFVCPYKLNQWERKNSMTQMRYDCFRAVDGQMYLMERTYISYLRRYLNDFARLSESIACCRASTQSAQP
mmetsp:Transcript_11993/g.10706  ORF Transcript_11993/g.10706 Transcript_11993/m.10706 type:complete len:110 (-) Transcript_11993:58-387(-)